MTIRRQLKYFKGVRKLQKAENRKIHMQTSELLDERKSRIEQSLPVRLERDDIEN
jgi:hypothetical protein